MQTSSPTQTGRWSAALVKASATGASAQTASQDGLPAGIAASQTMAKTDLSRVLGIIDRLQLALSLMFQ